MRYIVQSAQSRALLDLVYTEILCDVRGISDQKFKIFPNPTTGIATIQLNDKALYISRINVLNILGEKVRSFDVYKEASGSDNFSIDLTSLSEGTYFIDVMSSDRAFYSTVILVK